MLFILPHLSPFRSDQQAYMSASLLASIRIMISWYRNCPGLPNLLINLYAVAVDFMVPTQAT